MTGLRPRPARQARTIEPLAECDRPALDALVGADPIVNAVIMSRLADAPTLQPRHLGGELLAARAGRAGPLHGAIFLGGNLLPIGGDPVAWSVLGRAVAARPRRCTSVVGPADAVRALWHELEPTWGRARAIRAAQPLLVLRRGDLRVDAHPGLVRAVPGQVEAYLPAAAAMFTEELGVSPFDGRGGTGYRRRVESVLASGRACAVFDADGRVAFKADLGVITAATVQVQGVWTRPDLRGNGLGTAALAGVFGHALRLAPSVSLYVNEFNDPARRMYARLGMLEHATFSTILF